MTTDFPVFPADILAEVLALRPAIERILADEPGHRSAATMEDKVQAVLLKVTRHSHFATAHVAIGRRWTLR